MEKATSGTGVPDQTPEQGTVSMHVASEGTSSGTRALASEPQKLARKSLPPELIEKLISFLGDPDDAQTLILLSKYFKATVINQAAEREKELINQFIEFLCVNIDDEHNAQKEQLQELSKLINNPATFQLGDNLITIRSSIIEARNSIVDIMKPLNSESLILLKNSIDTSTLPSYFKNIFTLIALEQTWDSILKEDNHDTRIENFFSIAHQFASSKFFNRAIAIAKGYLSNKQCASLAIAIASPLINNIKVAEEIAKEITNEQLKNKILEEILLNRK